MNIRLKFWFIQSLTKKPHAISMIIEWKSNWCFLSQICFPQRLLLLGKHLFKPLKCVILTLYCFSSLDLLMFHPSLQQYYHLSFGNIKSICVASTRKTSWWERYYRYEIRFRIFYYYRQSFSLLLLFSLLIKVLDINLMRYSSRWLKILQCVGSTCN